ERGEHLAGVACPMLFVQGSRDELADVALVSALVDRLGPRATLAMFDDADHGFHVRARSGSNDADVLEHLLDTVAAWMARVHAAGPVLRGAVGLALLGGAPGPVRAA